MIHLINNGNIFESKCEALVCPVNCDGVMGKGLALEFKNRYPKFYENYKTVCKEHRLNPGSWFKYGSKELYGHDMIAFATKFHWRRAAELEYIAHGLQLFALKYAELDIKSVAFPAIGCGCGGLDWEDVYRLIKLYLDPLPIIVEVYMPYDE